MRILKNAFWLSLSGVLNLTAIGLNLGAAFLWLCSGLWLFTAFQAKPDTRVAPSEAERLEREAFWASQTK